MKIRQSGMRQSAETEKTQPGEGSEGGFKNEDQLRRALEH